MVRHTPAPTKSGSPDNTFFAREVIHSVARAQKSDETLVHHETLDFPTMIVEVHFGQPTSGKLDYRLISLGQTLNILSVSFRKI